MGLMDAIRQRLLEWLLPSEFMDSAYRTRLEQYGLRQQYYQGNYRKQLRVKPLQADDNIGLNLCGLVVDRGISMLLGNGVGFDFGENENAQGYIDQVWKANKSNIIMHKAAQLAGIYGTGYFKIVPDGAVVRSSASDIIVPRLIAIDPQWATIDTMQEDIETVQSYTLRYTIQRNGEPVARKEITEREFTADGDTQSWMITNYESDGQKDWVVTDATQWPYEFPPIIHWQNLPQPSDVYGQSDIDDIIELNDRINYIASNISRIIRYHAHPKTIGSGFSTGQLKLDDSIDSLWTIPTVESKVYNLEMQSDLASSRQFLMELRQALFDLSRTVDITSVADKLGSLTNFGLRVLFMDALNKIGTKQELFGEALIELNHRMLIMQNIDHDDGGTVAWADPLPVDEAGETTAITSDLNNDLVSKQTASRERGYDYEQEKQLMEEEKAGESNLGAQLLQAFNRGQ